MRASEIMERLKGYVPALAPTELRDPELERSISALDPVSEAALKAGLHLWNGSLDASHRVSQGIVTALGSYWHGIMHRMEGDYGNANYWFARAGRHPIHAVLQESAASILAAGEAKWLHSEPVGLRSKLEAIRYSPVWTPATFTSAAELCVRSGESPSRSLLEAIQYEEIRLLTKYSYEQNGGGTTLDTQ